MFLWYIKYIILAFTPSTTLLHPPYSRNSFNRYLFSVHIHVYTIFAPYSLSYTLSPPPPLSRWYQLPNQGLFQPSLLWFCKGKEKEIIVLLVYDSFTGNFLYFSSFYFSPFLMVLSTSFKTLYSFLYRDYIYHIHLNVLL
jgi:hypothetical protein